MAAAALTGLWAVWFAPQLTSSGIPFRRDTLLLFIPLRKFLRDSLLAGHLPQWFPYEGIGVPFIGQIVTATFHPETWLLLPFSAAVAVKLNIVGGYLWALIGGYKLARVLGTSRTGAVSGGAALAFSGYALSMSDNLPYLMGLATLPWVGWAAVRVGQAPVRRHVMTMALCWALVFLGGDAQSFVLAPLLMCACFAAVRAPLGAWLSPIPAGLLAVGCAAAEVLPAAVVFRRSSRLTSGFIIDVGTKFALHPLRLAELFIPHFLPGSVFPQASETLYGDRFRWSATLFAGGIVLTLSLAGLSRGRRTLPFVTLALLALTLAMGSRGLLLPIAWKVLPPLGAFRFPEKYLAFFIVALAPLVAVGIDAVRNEARRWQRGFFLGAMVLAAMAFLLLRVSLLTRLPQLPATIHEELRSSWSWQLARTAAFLWAGGLVLLASRRRPSTFALLPVLLSAELWLGNHGQLALVPQDAISASPFADTLRREPGEPPARVFSTARHRLETGESEQAHINWARDTLALLNPDVGALFGVSTIGASPLPGQAQNTRETLGLMGSQAAAVAGLFGATAEIVDAPATGDVLASDRGLILRAVDCHTTLCHPYAFLSGQPGADPDSAESQGGKVAHLTWSAGEFRLSVKAGPHARLNVAEGFSPGWTASIDGQPVTIDPTNGIAMSIPVWAGTHDVVFRYRTPLLGEGIAITLATLTLLLVLLAMDPTREKRRAPA